MKSMRILALAIVLTVCFGVVGFADVVSATTIDVNITVNAVAAIAVSGTDQTFVVGGAPAAGDLPVITDAGNLPTYLQYTSIVPATETRTIAVQADTGPPAGLVLNIRAGTPSGHGGVGTSVAGGINIDSTYVTADQNIVTGITSCATGTGGTQGPPVFYSLAIDEATFEDLDVAAATTMTITFTLVGS